MTLAQILQILQILTNAAGAVTTGGAAATVEEIAAFEQVITGMIQTYASQVGKPIEEVIASFHFEDPNPDA